MNFKLVTLLLCAALLGPTACKTDPGGLAGLRERGTLRVAVTGQFPPFNYYEDGTLVGFDIDIARALAAQLNVEPEFVAIRWDGILPGLIARRYELIIASMAITPERQKAVDFTAPYYESGAQLFTRPDSPLKSSDKLDGSVIGVNLGTTYEQTLRKKPEIKEIRTYGGVPELLMDLKRGRIDGFVTDRLVGLYAAKNSKTQLALAGEPLYRERMGIPMIKNQPELLTAVNEALAQIIADGTYDEISKKWFGRSIRTL